MKQCEKCGAVIAEGAMFCTNCGAPVNGVGASNGAMAGGTSNQPMNAVPISSGNIASNPSMSAIGGNVTGGAVTGGAVGAGTQNVMLKNNKGLIIGLAVVATVCLVIGIVGIVIGVNVGSKSSGQVASNAGAGASTTDVSSSGTKVRLGNYEVVMPDGYAYEMSVQNGVDAVAYTNNDTAYLAVSGYFDDVTWSAIQSRKNEIAAGLTQSLGISAETTAETKTVDGVEFVYFNFTMDGNKVTYALSEAGLYYFMTVIISNGNNTGDNYLANVATVLGSAQQKKEMNRAAGTVNVDINKLFKNSQMTLSQ